MDSYITYNEYSVTYGRNTIPEQDFTKFSQLASQKIRLHIMGRDFTGFEDDVKSATCQVADILYEQSQYKDKLKGISLGNDKLITSEKVDDYSRSLATPSMGELEKLQSDEYTNQLINDCVEEALVFTGLLNKAIGCV